jgi:hypothetical protein
MPGGRYTRREEFVQMKLKGFLLLAIVSALAAALWPAAGGAANFKGIVLAKQHGTMLVASPAGVVRAVSGRAAVGSRVVFSGGHATVVGHASRAHVRGIVVRRIGTTLLISSNRHLLALHTARVLAGTISTTPPAAPGTVVSAQVGIVNGQLDEQDEDDVGQVAGNSIMVTATITAVAPGSVTVDVQGQSLTVPLPAGLTLPASLVGQTVTIQLSLAGNGDDQGDDDQGDDNGGDNGGGSGGGGHGGGGDG